MFLCRLQWFCCSFSFECDPHHHQSQRKGYFTAFCSFTTDVLKGNKTQFWLWKWVALILCQTHIHHISWFSFLFPLKEERRWKSSYMLGRITLPLVCDTVLNRKQLIRLNVHTPPTYSHLAYCHDFEIQLISSYMLP